MRLVTGDALDPKKFFKSGSNPPVQGSSFDLTIGCIFDHEGKKVEGPFTIKPRHMVQVVSSEVFDLSDQITGHVTYRTRLTRNGIWALTVGIVDPGWKGPIATTLLNFSRVDHVIAKGDPFLRVSFFEHDPVPAERLRRAPQQEDYLKDVQKIAASMFPITFLDTEEIAEKAGSNVLTRIRTEALGWVAGIVAVFTLQQMAVNYFTRPERPSVEVSRRDLDTLRERMDAMQIRLLKSEQVIPPAPPSTQSPPPDIRPPSSRPQNP